MIAFLYGPDEYRRHQKINEFREGFQKKGTEVLSASFDCEEKEGVETLRVFATNPSLFTPYRFAVLTNVFAYEKEKELIELLKSLREDTTILCVISEERAPRTSYAWLTKKPALSQRFTSFTQSELAEWIIREAKKRRLTVESDRMSYLQLNYGSNLWGIITELDTLALQEKGHAVEKDHDLLHADFFGLASQLRVGGSPKDIFPALEVLLEREDPARIFNFIAYRAQSEDKPVFADLDIAVKSGKLDYDAALLSALIR
jgi:DNA polymerase III delta subunit